MLMCSLPKGNNHRFTMVHVASQLHWALPPQWTLLFPGLLAVRPPVGSSTSAFAWRNHTKVEDIQPPYIYVHKYVPMPVAAIHSQNIKTTYIDKHHNIPPHSPSYNRHAAEVQLTLSTRCRGAAHSQYTLPRCSSLSVHAAEVQLTLSTRCMPAQTRAGLTHRPQGNDGNYNEYHSHDCSYNNRPELKVSSNNYGHIRVQLQGVLWWRNQWHKTKTHRVTGSATMLMELHSNTDSNNVIKH